MWREGKQENPGKNPRSKARTNNKLNPHMAPSRNRTRATSVGSKPSHHCAIPSGKIRKSRPLHQPFIQSGIRASAETVNYLDQRYAKLSNEPARPLYRYSSSQVTEQSSYKGLYGKKCLYSKPGKYDGVLRLR